MYYLRLEKVDQEDPNFYHTMKIFERIDESPNIREDLERAIKTVTMENWGKWLGVKKTLVIHELESYIIASEWSKFFDFNGNTEVALNTFKGIYAQIELQQFDKGGAIYEHRLIVNFFTKNK